MIYHHVTSYNIRCIMQKISKDAENYAVEAGFHVKDNY